MSTLINPWPVVPSWMHEPPEPEWPGDWRLPDEREERLAELYLLGRRRVEDEIN